MRDPEELRAKWKPFFVNHHYVARVRELMGQDRTLMAIHELRAATKAPLAFAHLWVAHRGLPLPPEGADPTPCPYCGKTLRTALARQCRHCKRDWHDPDNVSHLGDPAQTSMCS